MLEELYQALKNDLRLSMEPKKVIYDRYKDYLFIGADGEQKFIVGAPKNKTAECNDIDTLTANAATFDQSSELWYNRNQITLFSNSHDHENAHRVFMKLELSPQFNRCSVMENSKVISQRELRKLLKVDFYGCVPETLVDVISKVNWTLDSSGESEIVRGKASLGNKLTQQIKGLVDIPEYVDVTVPVFKSKVYFAAKMKFYLEPDPETKNFSFYPIPGEIEKALCDAEKEIGKYLTAQFPEGFPIYFGAVSL